MSDSAPVFGRSRWNNAGNVTRMLALGLGILLLCLPAFSQLNLGRIFGGITDQSGGAMAGATVTVIDTERGVSRPLTTDSAGEYSAPSLLPGTYTIRVEAMGFQTAEHAGVVVQVGQDVRVDLTMQPGQQTQTITVTGDLPNINTTNATLGGTVENTTIDELPVSGRAFTKFLDYAPGMQALPGGTTPSYTSNGVRANNNTWMFDGLDDIKMDTGTGPAVGGNGGGVDGLTILPLDAIQEINTIQNPKAEFGWNAGAQVNVGLKSGTNNVHGTAYAYGRDEAMDARNAFLTPGSPASTDQLKQFGASIGGPIKKDKIFYFANYEGQRYVIGSNKTVTEPTTTSGSLAAVSIPDAIASMNSAGHSNLLNPMSLEMAGCNPALINAGMTTGAAIVAAGACNAAAGLFGNSTSGGTYPTAFNNVGGSDNGIGKVDYHINDHNALNGEYFIGDGNILNAVAATQPYWASIATVKSQLVRVVDIWTPNSTWVNEARFGFNRYTAFGAPAECTEQLGQPNYNTAYGFVSGAATPPGLCGFPLLTISGFTQLGSAPPGTGASRSYFNVWSGIDSVSYTRGKHLFKFGGEFHLMDFHGSLSLTNDTGTLTFGGTAAYSGATALQDFLAGVVNSAAILQGNANRNITLNRYAGFAQDDWRFTPRITVNLGLRYEYVTPVYDANNLLGNFNAGAPTGLYQQTTGNPVYHNSPYNFSPRLGIVWDVTGKGTTVVRAGGSLIYNLTLMSNLMEAPQGSLLNAVPTGFALYNAAGTAIPSPGNIATGTVTTAGAAVNSPIPWAQNTPVFNTAQGSLACGNGLVTVTPAAGPAFKPQPCALFIINPHQPTAYVTTWALDVQHAFSGGLSLDIGYVGNHGTNLPSQPDLNQPLPGTSQKTGTTAATNELLRRPYYQQFPYFGSIDYETNAYISNYDGLQTSLRERLSHGLTFTAAYTFAHTLDQSTSQTGNQMMNSNTPLAEYGDATVDARSHFTLAFNYEVPGIKAPGQILQGWQINTAYTALGAVPFNAVDTTSDISGTGELKDRWSIAGDPSNIQAGGPGPIPCFAQAGVPANPAGTPPTAAINAGSFASATNCTKVATGTFAAPWANMPAACIAAAAAEPNSPAGVPNTLTAGALSNATGLQSLASFGCYDQNGTVIVPPAQGTYGDMGRDVLRDKPFREWDLSVSKTFKFRERFSAQFRAEFYNILNHTEYAIPSSNPNSPTTFGLSQSTPNQASLIIGNGGPRLIQLGLKLGF